VKRKTRKLIFIATAALLVSLLFTCKPFGAGDYNGSDRGGVTYTDVEYSPDGRSVTIYLDGSKPVSNSRALTHSLARLGHDYFEVAFYDSATNTIARAAWETGHAAGVSGVARGVDYGSPNPGSNGTSNSAAILFVGKRSDRTLLAVGRLTGSDGGGTPTEITANTRSVTFSVVALEAGTSYFYDKSSFLTNANGGGDIAGSKTIIADIIIARYHFPLFGFPKGATILAKYTIGPIPPPPIDDPINNYLNGIRVAGAPSVTITIPQYPLGNGEHDNSSVFYPDYTENTFINITNNNSVGTAFANEILFQIITGNDDDGRINAFYFEIPVYPLNSAGNRGLNNFWYIRPGYDSYLRDLDDGDGGTGGSILFGVGDLQALDYRLNIAKEPLKINYSTYYSYDFDPEGLIAYMQVGVFRVHRVEIEHLTFWVNCSFSGQTMNPGAEEIFFDVIPLDPDHPTGLWQYFNPLSSTCYAINGMLTITAVYEDSEGKLYHDYFVVYDSDLSGVTPGDIGPNNRFIISSWLDLIDFYNRVDPNADGGAFLLVFTTNFNLNRPIIFNRPNKTIIILAAAPNLIFGKETDADCFVNYGGYPGENDYFLGVWPFNEPVIVDGRAITTYPYAINTTGRWQQVVKPLDPTDPEYNNMDTWISTGTYTDGLIRIQLNNAPPASANVQLGGGVKVLGNNLIVGFGL
jgi:hypothetical protein